jgi:hypothetical protein
MNDDDGVPMPGQTEFTADQEKAMRQGAAEAEANSDAIGGSTWSETNLKTGKTTTVPFPTRRITRDQF